MYKAIIVDDEIGSQMALSGIIEMYCPDIHVSGTFGTVESCVKEVLSDSPDILILDVNLADGTGFDILDKIGALSLKVILVSAHDHYGVDAFKYKADNYLLKPINPNQLKLAIDELIKEIKADKTKNDLLVVNETLSEKKLGIPTKGSVKLVRLNSIIRCEASVNYTYILTQDIGRQIVPKTIKTFENLLSSEGFIRCHQSHLINPRYLAEISIKDNKLVMQNGDKIPISRKYKQKIVNHFKLKIN